jgi:hypothetical protein
MNPVLFLDSYILTGFKMPLFEPATVVWSGNGYYFRARRESKRNDHQFRFRRCKEMFRKRKSTYVEMVDN